MDTKLVSTIHTGCRVEKENIQTGLNPKATTRRPSTQNDAPFTTKYCITVTQLYLDIQCISCLCLEKMFSSFSAFHQDLVVRNFTCEVSLCNKSSTLITVLSVKQH